MVQQPLQPQQKKKQVHFTNNSILESLRGLGTGVGKSLARDVAGGVGKSALSSLFGSTSTIGEFQMSQRAERSPERFPHMGLQRTEATRPPVVKLEEIGIKQKIESVRSELKALTASLKTLNTEIAKAVSEVPVHPGVYHENFFDRLRSIIKVLREQIEDSRSWLALWTQRKQKRNFWGLYKKHGTQFGLSSERTIATQAG